MAGRQGPWERIFRTLASVKTGIILLILVGVVAAAGTIILQRPITDPADMQRAYSPQTLQWLDRLALTDVYHSWWFALLMAILGCSIICASIDRFPKAWRLLSRPYRHPEPHFRAALPIQKKISVPSASAGLMAAERAFRRSGLRPERVVQNDEVSLFAERHRWSVLAVYVVHTSLLLILAGGIVDAIWGYKSYVSLSPGQSTNQLELAGGKIRPLPFTLRCDGTGQENYPDGSPKKWWSQLTVLENGREVLHKEIVVNDPLVTHGVRFYQSGYGMSGDVASVALNVKPLAGGQAKQITLRPGQSTELDADTHIRLAEFIPDFVIRDNQIYARSKDPVNPALRLVIAQQSSGQLKQVWLFPAAGQQSGDVPYKFEVADLQMAAFTGLQVSHEPGQWAVWAGCLLMGLGLAMAFYMVHQRYWAIAVEDDKQGMVLWIGTAADKNREHFQERFAELAREIEAEVAAQGASRASAQSARLVSV